mgnify:CR=1 FL=1
MNIGINQSILRVANIGVIAHIDDALVFKARIDDSLGGKLTSYRDNLFVVDRFLSRSDPENGLDILAGEVKAKIYYNWAKDLAWHGHTAQSILRSAQYFGYSRTLKNLMSTCRFIGRSAFKNKKQSY